MGRSLVSAAALAAITLLSVVRADIPTCGPNNPCPASSPCCSQYGQCGVGAYCLGGCDPLFSHTLDSCVPAPVCDSSKFKIDGLSGVTDIAKYLGDASKTNWVSTGKPLEYNGGVLLTMAQDTVGTLLASSHYVWYGKITAKMTTSQGKGVVTAFIMMSDVRDEIDFEFVGTDINTAQSNFYSQGVTNYNNGENLKMSSDTVNQEHEYVIDWQPDTLTWSIDGKTMRTLNRKDTWNATSNRFDYPQTPSRVMLSLWPAGLPSNGEGTIEWAGGLVDWSSQYMQNGYYYAHFSSIEVECYDPPSGATKDGSKTYIYDNEAGTNDTVVISDKQVILGSLQATGEDPDKGKASSSSSADGSTKTSSASSASSTAAEPESVPGVSGGGNRGDTGSTSSSDSSDSSGSDGSSTSDGSDSSSSSSSSSSQTFSQGGDDSNSSSDAPAGLHGVGASVIAFVAAFASLLIL
ncbi:putative cell wall glucanase protein [Lasiodiplodia theobromae]|nr:putative cell wall glucanase protein [Lasiodiplodia theobromae]